MRFYDGIPNCVPEYYREQQEVREHKEEKYYDQLENVKGLTEIHDLTMIELCDVKNCLDWEILRPLYPEYEEDRFFCKHKQCKYKQCK